MKNILTAFCLIACNFASAQSGIQWSAPVSVAAVSFDNLHPRVVTDASGNAIIIWGKMSNDKLYFSKWNGTAFTMPMPLNPASVPVFTASWAGPDIDSRGDTVYAVYKQTPEDTGHIYCVASFNGGASFSSPVRVDYTADSLSRFPSVSAGSDGNPLIAFMKFDPGFANPRYVAVKSNDFGMSFGADVPASGYSGGEVCDCCPASVVSEGSRAVVMYRDNLGDIRNMWAGISTDGGNSFPGSLQMDYGNWMVNSCPSSGPDGVIIDDSLYMVYMSKASGKETVYFSKASLTSLQASTDMQVSSSLTGIFSQNFPRMAHHGNAVAVAIRQTTNTTDHAALSFTNNIHRGLPSMPDTAVIGNILNVDVALSDTTIHLVWEDGNTGTVMYRKGKFVADTPAVSSVLQHEEDYGVQLYPNPASGILFIETSTPYSTARIFDLTGRLITDVEFSRQLDISRIERGVYMLELSNGNGSRYLRFESL